MGDHDSDLKNIEEEEGAMIKKRVQESLGHRFTQYVVKDLFNFPARK
jgi:hypothetical protein